MVGKCSRGDGGKGDGADLCQEVPERGHHLLLPPVHDEELLHKVQCRRVGCGSVAGKGEGEHWLCQGSNVILESTDTLLQIETNCFGYVGVRVVIVAHCCRGPEYCPKPSISCYFLT